MKKNLFTAIATGRGIHAGLLFLRVAAGLLLMRHGIMKFMNFGTLSDTFADPLGIGPELSLTLISLAETLGSLFLIIGLLTRPVAIVLIFGMGVAAFGTGFGFDHSEMPLVYMVIFIFFLFAGAGRYSLDNSIAARVQK